MNNYSNQYQSSGSNDAFLKWAAVILAGLLFVRTMDVLSYFSPQVLNDLIGFDVSWVYGGICGFFIEGVSLYYHFSPRAQKYAPAQITKFLLLGISAACQVFDGRIIQGTLADMPEAQKMIFSIGVPLLPIVVLLLLFFVGNLPNENAPRKPFVGLKNMFKPTFKRLWEGEQAVGYMPVQTNQIVRQMDQHQLPTPDDMATRADGNEVGNNANGNFPRQGGRN